MTIRDSNATYSIPPSPSFEKYSIYALAHAPTACRRIEREHGGRASTHRYCHATSHCDDKGCWQRTDAVDMDGRPSLSPPLPPDPRPTTRKAHVFKEPLTAQSPSIQPQQQPLPADLNRPNTSRSRAASRTPSVRMHQPQPIQDAVNNAVGHAPGAQSQFDQEDLIRQVTEQVIKSLQAANMGGPTPTASTQPQQSRFVPPPPPQAQYVPRSPAHSSIESPRRYTPPSPGKRPGRGGRGYDSTSPDPVQSDHDSSYSRESSRRSNSSLRDRVKPRSPHNDGTERIRRDLDTSKRKPVTSNEHMRESRDSESNSTARDKSRPARQDSVGSESDYYEAPSSRSRIPAARVLSDINETTTLERIWQPLFDKGNPTVRLGQFLRGLALHLIDNYEPKGSLVVTPMKMLRFFGEVKVADEAYPWDVIFGGKLSNNSLSRMYQKLLCQHHLVQTQNHEIPTVPGLTPDGFEGLMTCLIQAHPDTEYERLAKAVMNMPISNADNKSERFPKELSRRLFPAQSNLHAEQRIVASLNHEPVLVKLRGSLSMPPPPPASALPSQPTFPSPQTSFTERERKPYAQASFSNSFDDDDLLGQPAVPIERERMPYSAKEGLGKMFDANEDRDNRPPTSYRPNGQKRRNSRSSSNVPTQATYSNSHNNTSHNTSEPVSIPPPKNRRMSVDRGPPPAMFNNNAMNGMNGSVPKTGRNTPPPQAGRRTPPPRNFSRSEPADVNGIPPNEYRSNLHSGYQTSTRDRFAGGDSDDDSRRRHRSRRPTDRSGNGGNNTEDDLPSGRGYPIPPRQPPSTQQGFDSSYNTGPPVGSYPRGGGGGMDARRNTWYGANNMAPNLPASGSDGYGSFAASGSGSTQQPYGSSAQQY